VVYSTTAVQLTTAAFSTTQVVVASQSITAALFILMGAAQSLTIQAAHSTITQAALFILMGAVVSSTTAGQQSTITRAARLVLRMGHQPVEREQYRVLVLLLVLSQLTQIAPRNILESDVVISMNYCYYEVRERVNNVKLIEPSLYFLLV